MKKLRLKIPLILTLLLVGFFSFGQPTLPQQRITETWFLNGEPSRPQPISFGNVYNASSWSDLSDFSANTTTANIVGNKIQLTGGAGTFSQRLELDYVTALENFTVTMRVVMGPKGATSWGVGLGFRSNNTWTGQGHSMLVQVTNTLGSTPNVPAGRLYIYSSPDRGVTNTNRAINDTNDEGVSWSDADEVEIVLQRAVNICTVKVRNVTTGGPQASSSYTWSLASAGAPVMPNTGHFNVYNYGGTITIQSLTVSTTDKKHARIVVVGDSKTSYNAVSLSQRWPTILATTYTDITVLAGASSRTAEILTIVPEIIAFAPQQVILNIGRNDIAQGVTQGTREANYASIVSQLQAAGIRVKHLLPIENDNVDQSTLEAFINANYAASDIITAPLVTAPDGAHPDVSGHSSIANAIVSSGKIN